jgi:hypothetical protein
MLAYTEGQWSSPPCLKFIYHFENQLANHLSWLKCNKASTHLSIQTDSATKPRCALLCRREPNRATDLESIVPHKVVEQMHSLSKEVTSQIFVSR